MAIVEVSDFDGRFLLAKTTYKVDEIQSYIDEFVAPAIAKLLGAELGAEFVNDLDNSGVPQTQKFIDLYNAFQKDICGMVVISKGMKHYLIGIIYWWYIVEDRVRPSAAGGSGQAKGENSESGTRPAAEHYQRYNSAIETGKAIQTFVEMNQDEYPNFNGQLLLYASII